MSRSVNLNYLDPATVDIADYEADPDTFVEPHAGEVLYRLRPGAKGVPAGEPDGRLPSAEGFGRMNAPAAAKRKTAVVVMGVAGSGKSTVGQILARRLGWHFAEADDFHSAANVAKMAAATPPTQ